MIEKESATRPGASADAPSRRGHVHVSWADGVRPGTRIPNVTTDESFRALPGPCVQARSGCSAGSSARSCMTCRRIEGSESSTYCRTDFVIMRFWEGS
jgi:hypothetical protein